MTDWPAKYATRSWATWGANHPCQFSRCCFLSSRCQSQSKWMFRASIKRSCDYDWVWNVRVDCSKRMHHWWAWTSAREVGYLHCITGQSKSTVSRWVWIIMGLELNTYAPVALFCLTCADSCHLDSAGYYDATSSSLSNTSVPHSLHLLTW